MTFCFFSDVIFIGLIGTSILAIPWLHMFKYCGTWAPTANWV